MGQPTRSIHEPPVATARRNPESVSSDEGTLHSKFASCLQELDIEMQMLLFVFAALAACASPAYAGSCGNTLMYNNFNKYQGGYQTYTKSMMQQDFPPGANKIMTSQGQEKFTGLVFLKFDYNAEVGQGIFRAKNPKGTPGIGMHV